MEQETRTLPEKEPSVLDLYKSVTKDWASFFNFVRSVWDARRREEINQALAYEAQQTVAAHAVEPVRVETFPWRVLLAMGLALTAQALVEPPQRFSMVSVTVYLAAFGLAFWSYRSHEWHLPALPAIWRAADPLTIRLVPLGLAVFLAWAAFINFKDGLFTGLNVSLWLLSIVLLLVSFWVPAPRPAAPQEETPAETPGKTWSFSGVEITFKDFSKIQRTLIWSMLVLAAFGLGIFFRLYQLDQIPNEPFSDHADKILDVYELSQGQTWVFFERNTGREAIQMYWTLLVLNLFGTGFSFYSLKLGTALLGILTLPFVYQIGKEFGNERVALYALILFGVASWPNIISRIGLRFPLYPLFVAPTLLYLIRGLRTQNRNDFLLAGLFLGLGLHGYSPFRIMPFMVAAAFFIYFLHAGSKENRQQAIFWFLLVALVSFFVFLPLMRYWLSNPEMFGYRAFSRVSSIETPLPGPAWQIFLSNLYKGLLMFNWYNGEIWVNSVTGRPALDVITAALFLMGIVFLLTRYIRQRDWRDLALLISIPALIMPSVLSLAFPAENPAMNRAGGASVTATVIAAVALDGLASSFRSGKNRKIIAAGIAAALLAGATIANYDIVFRQFKTNYSQGSWNTSEIGRVISDFEEKYGQTDTVWIVPYPYWVDTRLPGVWAGIPDRDFALFPENLAQSLSYPAPKMFIYWNADPETERLLRELYPNGNVSRYTSAFEGKDFFIYLVEQ
ncbi:MAG: glycosyltransferase family 39 protein [Chloroflexi bacterium]|nr:glycosyltransferase family 39 protein [Chloroflexota bacterium]